MPDAEYDKLEAGPELDALIAEKVMGHRVEWRNGKPMWVGGEEIPGSPVVLGGGLYGHFVEAYSKDIRRAWDVIEAVILRFGCDVEINYNCGNPGTWDVAFFDDYPGYPSLNGKEFFGPDSPTAQLAICRSAAILAQKKR